MKKITVILFISFFGFASGQTINPDSTIAFIKKNIGKKVGDGVCHSLVDKAIGGQDATWLKEKSDKRRYRRNHPKVGDVIVFDMVILAGEPLIASHMGIVYKVNGDGTIIIAEQNVGNRGDKMKGKAFANSHVQFSKVDLDAIEHGKIYFYRY